ncbi:hypothetical protein ACIU3Q_002271 [Salmonella enterica subsp. enterica serovar Kokomlemle]
MKGRVLVWLLMLSCLCGGLALHYMVYREVRQELSLFYPDD